MLGTSQVINSGPPNHKISPGLTFSPGSLAFISMNHLPEQVGQGSPNMPTVTSVVGAEPERNSEGLASGVVNGQHDLVRGTRGVNARNKTAASPPLDHWFGEGVPSHTRGTGVLSPKFCRMVFRTFVICPWCVCGVFDGRVRVEVRVKFGKRVRITVACAIRCLPKCPTHVGPLPQVILPPPRVQRYGTAPELSLMPFPFKRKKATKQVSEDMDSNPDGPLIWSAQGRVLRVPFK